MNDCRCRELIASYRAQIAECEQHVESPWPGALLPWVDLLSANIELLTVEHEVLHVQAVTP